MNRTIFVVDGFNLYHSLVDAGRDANKATTKWLDLRKLCNTYLSGVGEIVGERVSLERVYYYSAPPTHQSREKISRHKYYMKCLRGTGVNVELSRFKAKEIFCTNCKSKFIGHEEKETDVALATRLFEVCQTNEADTVILMTGDTDLAPAVRTCKRLFPMKHIFFIFPYKRTNNELKALAPESFSIRLNTYLKHQFPDPLVLDNGQKLPKPDGW